MLGSRKLSSFPWCLLSSDNAGSTVAFVVIFKNVANVVLSKSIYFYYLSFKYFIYIYFNFVINTKIGKLQTFIECNLEVKFSHHLNRYTELTPSMEMASTISVTSEVVR